MRPDDGDLDEEIRGHLAINIKQRIERGEDPIGARRAAMLEFGYVPAVREGMRRVWYSRWYDETAALARDIRLAVRSLARAKALTLTVIVTLALGIGANAAIFSVVRSVLLRPLVNRDADRLIYIRQDAQGLGIRNLTFSVPEIGDFKSRSKTVAMFGDFSTVDFTLVGFNREPRLVRAGVVNGSYFEVMGLRPVLGRLLTPADDGPGAPGAVVLTHRFWKDVLSSDPAVIGQPVSLGTKAAVVVGVLEPSVPYPTETEIIANMVTSAHHLGATMNTDRKHRMTDLFGRIAPGVSVDAARAELIGLHASMLRDHPDAYSPQARITPGTNRRLRIFATTQIACTFVLLAAAGMLVTTLTALQTAHTGYDLRQVLAIDLPARVGPGLRDPARNTIFEEMTRRIAELPGVERVATAAGVPFRDRGATRLRLAAEGYQPANGEEAPTARFRTIPKAISRCSACRCSRAATSRTPIAASKTAMARNSSPSSTRAWRGGCFRTATRSIAASRPAILAPISAPSHPAASSAS